MNLAELQAVIPILIVVATALITLAVEAFRGKDERLPLGVLGLIGLVRLDECVEFGPAHVAPFRIIEC